MAAVKTNPQLSDLLHHDDDFISAILNTISGIVVILDRDGRIVLFNKECERLANRPSDEIQGLFFWDLLTVPKEREEAKADFLKLRSGDLSAKGESSWRTQKGERRVIEWTSTFFQNNQGEAPYIIVTGVDATDWKRTEIALSVSEARFKDLYENAPLGIYRTSPDGKILLSNPALLNMLGFATLEELAERNLEFEGYGPTYSRTDFRSDLEKKGEVHGLESEWVRKDGASIFVRENAKAIRDEQGTVLYYEGTVEDITERKHAEMEVSNSLLRLNRTFEETVRALSTVVEKRDPYTHGHQQRVTHIACRIGAVMGLSDDIIAGIRIAALLHDIGKIQIPAEILGKPGLLNAIESSFIRNHPQLGYEILMNIDFPWPVAKAVLQHHERLDGSGYPHGLSGDEIILEARIIGVADVFESMASHRPYRPSRGPDAAFEELLQYRGKLFDAQIVDALLLIKDQVIGADALPVEDPES